MTSKLFRTALVSSPSYSAFSLQLVRATAAALHKLLHTTGTTAGFGLKLTTDSSQNSSRTLPSTACVFQRNDTLNDASSANSSVRRGNGTPR